jgi:hypothetical protein
VSEIASYVPTRTWRGRLWGIVAIVAPSAGAIAAAITDQPYTAPQVDVKRCRNCGGRMTVRAVVTDPASIAKLLGALRRSRDPPVAA